MARKPTGRPIGRPRKEIEQEEFEKLCGLQCSLDEIAGWFGCSCDTVERWCDREYGEHFAVVYKKHSGTGKIALRRNQLKLSETNASMAIWLGKQYLGQREPEAERGEEVAKEKTTVEIVFKKAENDE